MAKTIGVLGAGSWGTALAQHLADQDFKPHLWARREVDAENIRRERENARYLPGIKLSSSIEVTSSLAEVVSGIDLLLSVLPSQVTRQVLSNVRGHLGDQVPVLCASKGIESKSLALMSEVLQNVLPDRPHAFLAGPSFAKEVALGHPTAVVIASKHTTFAEECQSVLSDERLRVYVSSDVVGLELGGALKNVIAIACGCADGMGLGLNTRAALITRGLAEVTRLSTKMGGDPLTLSGLAGMGDLVLTCTGDLSRNRRVGIGLGQGRPLDEILKDMGQVAEGVETARSAYNLATREGVDAPIIAQMYEVLYRNKPAQACVAELMARSLKSE